MRIVRAFKVQSLEGIGTDHIDLDKGVIRVSKNTLRELGGRNSLVRITNSSGATMVRSVRAKTGQNALSDNQIALQYEDRLHIGVKDAGTEFELTIERINPVLGIIAFNWNHTSPLIRLQTAFAFWTSVVSLIVGFLLGLIFK
jgi:hypothetical protein